MGNEAKTRFELAVIDKVIEVRRAKGFTQEQIASILDLTKGFIGQIETPTHPSKYNLNHLNRLAYEFGCSIADLLPTEPIIEKDWD